MKTSVVNVKIDPETKKQAQKVAEELGLSLSAIVTAQLKQLIRTKTIVASTEETPTPYMLRALAKSEADVRAGRVSPAFTNADEALAWLKNPKRKYANEIR